MENLTRDELRELSRLVAAQAQRDKKLGASDAFVARRFALSQKLMRLEVATSRDTTALSFSPDLEASCCPGCDGKLDDPLELYMLDGETFCSRDCAERDRQGTESRS